MPNFTKIEQDTINSCRADNAVNSAILMNPTNFPFRTNKKILDGWFHKGGISHGIVLKTVPGTPGDLFCSAGVTTAFGLCNGDMVGCGGFPKDSSSQIVYNEASFFPKKFVFTPGVHYELGSSIHQGYLTQAGINLFNEVGKLQGAVYSVRKPNGTGHIGIVMATELEKVGPPVNKWRAWMYTIEYNTKNGTPNKLLNQLQNKSDFIIQTLRREPANYYEIDQKSKNPNYKPSEKEGDERTGGKLAYRARLIGGLWFCDPATGETIEVQHVTVAPTNQFKGGVWAPKGLSSRDNTFDLFGLDPFNRYPLLRGSWYNWKWIFEP